MIFQSTLFLAYRCARKSCREREQTGYANRWEWIGNRFSRLPAFWIWCVGSSGRLRH